MEKKLLILFGFAALFVACKKEITVPNSGIYSGTFTQYDTAGNSAVTGNVYFVLYESNQTFFVRGDTVTDIPVTHNGSYVVDHSTQMTFKYTGDYDSLIDLNQYLDTIYNYTFDDINFTLSQTRDGKLYEYIMQRD
ncbi:MAG: hypothetical protein HUJ25_17440 [Crocinitomicaceae bacterium]|nr:hypothetical protein [Crocinitomicaceae bacterium]